VRKGYTYFEDGDVIFAKITPCMENGKTAVVRDLENGVGFGSTEFHVVRHPEEVTQEWIFHYLIQEGFRRDAKRRMTGSAGQKRVPTGYMEDVEIPVPHLPEQHRIVAKIEELFSNLDAGMADLQTAQRQLERYRLSVLQAAVEGRLTATWRRKTYGRDMSRPNDVEPADALLGRILDERRQQWEKDYRAKYEAKGKEPPSGWKSRYSDPQPLELEENAPEIPSTWIWTNLDHLTVRGPQNGLYLPKKKYGSGVPILRIDDFQDGWSRSVDDLQKVDAADKDVNKYALETGDLVINRVNSMSHLGKCLVVDERNLPSLFESNMMRLHLTSLGEPRFVEYYLRSASGRRTLLQNAKHAVNQASINQGDVKETPVPLPPLAEQKQIVAEVERLLSVADDAAQTTEREHTRAKRLRQSILKQAFSGQLVPHKGGTATAPAPSGNGAQRPGEQIEMEL